MENFIKQLKSDGFSGFVTVGQLMLNPAQVTSDGGVYMILRDNTKVPKFLSKGTGGFFKKQDPNVPIDELRDHWIDDSPVLYIGKASKSLKKRLKQYMQFGAGKSVGHYGGRYIWQLADSRELIVCWKPILNCDPRIIEAQMIQQFKEEHSGRRPFANLVD